MANARDTAIQIKTHIMSVGTERGGFQAFLMSLPAEVRYTQSDVTAICEELDRVAPFPLGVHYWQAMFNEVMADRIVATAPGLPDKREGIFAGMPTWGKIALGIGCAMLLRMLGIFGAKDDPRNVV